MSEVNETIKPEQNFGLTDSQKEQLAKAYSYRDLAEYTDEDVALAKQMFDTPEKFALLRKILQVLTPSERGLTMPNPVNFVDAEPSDYKKFAFEVSVDRRADEKVRQTLLAFYRLLRGSVQADLEESMKEQNKADFEEKERTEKFKENQKEESRDIGPNI